MVETRVETGVLISLSRMAWLISGSRKWASVWDPRSVGVLVPLSGGCVLGEQVLDIGRKSGARSYNGEHRGLSLRLIF